MKNIIKLGVAAVIAVALSYTASAVPITGNIGFSGTAVLDTGSVVTATKVVSWGTNTVGAESGTFALYNGGIPIGTQVTLAAPWNYSTGGALANFWQVGGFTFNLLSSTSAVFVLNGTTYLNIALVGTVSGNGFTATAFTGSFSTQNPPADGVVTFTESLSFNSVPDGGTTVLLLGTALSGLALLKRKFMA